MEERTLADYVNLERSLNLMSQGPIEGIYNTVDLIQEHELIQEKKSKLSRRNRDRIETIYSNACKRYNSDKENGTSEMFDKLSKFLNECTQVLSKIIR